MEFEFKDQYNIQDLLDIIRILRSPEGCPWDREQTHESIRVNLIEETYEVVDAIDSKDSSLLKEELGDLLLQVVLHTQMEQEQQVFNFGDVCDGICKKLIHRHPHVFKGRQVSGTEQVLQNWEEIKNQEKGRHTAADRFSSIPPSLPGLLRSQKTQARAENFGFDYDNALAALQDLESEIQELKQAIAQGEGIQHEIGDVLFSAVNVSRHFKIDAEHAITDSTNRFISRILEVERLAAKQGLSLEELNPAQRHELWKKAKGADTFPAEWTLSTYISEV